MKLQVDTNLKTITVEESINLGELMDVLNDMFPKFAWREFTICPVKTIEHWTNPISIPWTPWQPITTPWVTPGTAPYTPSWGTVTCSGNANGVSLAAGNCSVTNLANAAGAVSFTSNSVHNLIINKHESK